MIKVYISIALLLVTNVGTAFIAHRLTSAQYIKQENQLIIDQVEKYNDGLKKLEESTKKLEAIKTGVRTEIHHIPGIDTSLPCPIDDIVRLRNEAYRALPDVYFQSPKPLPASD